MSRTPLEQAKRDLEYFGRINGEALTNERHIDHYEASEQYAALNRNLLRLQGIDPNAPADGYEPTGGLVR
jgi:hypothetical protein